MKKAERMMLTPKNWAPYWSQAKQEFPETGPPRC
jgi:hypothetical protein